MAPKSFIHPWVKGILCPCYILHLWFKFISQCMKPVVQIPYVIDRLYIYCMCHYYLSCGNVFSNFYTMLRWCYVDKLHFTSLCIYLVIVVLWTSIWNINISVSYCDDMFAKRNCYIRKTKILNKCNMDQISSPRGTNFVELLIYQHKNQRVPILLHILIQHICNWFLIVLMLYIG